MLNHSNQRACLVSLVAFVSSLSVACGGSGGSGADAMTDDTETSETSKKAADTDPEKSAETDPESAAGGAGNEEVVETTPEVIDTNIHDGDTRVLPDESIWLEFNVPINADSFEANYISETLPKDNVTFSWSGDAKVVTITPKEDLEYAVAFSLANLEPAVAYSFTVANGLTSQDGEVMGENYSVNFHTARGIITQLTPSGDLNGHVRSDGKFHAIYGDDLFAGDSSNQDELGDAQYVAVMSFDLSGLDKTAFAIGDAVLQSTQTVFNNDPEALAEFATVYDISATERTWIAVSPELSAEHELGDMEINEIWGLSLNVSDALEADLQSSSVSSYAFALENPRNNNGATDIYKYTDTKLMFSYWLE